jgi:trehalose 6-phosphate phosphatase
LLLPPPATLSAGDSLFLDFDGTLVALVDRPDAVTADGELRDLLLRLNDRLKGRLAVISGRSIAQLEGMLGPVAQAIALSGSHGSELRAGAVRVQPERPAALDRAAERLGAFAERHAGTLLETKSYGVALHYRMRPEAEAAATALAEDVARELDLELQGGKMMVELRTPGADKGVAVRRLMDAAPMRGTRPLFVGDDRTDEHGFGAAAALGGAGILVGPVRDTAAAYRLDDPAAVRRWLMEIAA